MKVLVINAGSSSLKYKLMDMDNELVMAKGLCERIGLDKSRLKHTPEGGETVVIEKDMPDHSVAIKLVLDALTDKDHGVISDMSEISAVGHRVVHGGEVFSGSVLITDEVKKAVTECNSLAPLHNPANLTGIAACEEAMPGVPNVGVFDTAFHQTMPKESYMYGIPYEYYEKYKIRKYGFHGTSHNYVSHRVAEIIGKPIEELKIITFHLGNGSSIAAVKNGKVVDTSMGFTPLDGLVMGTRSGSIDPAIIQFLVQNEGMTVEEVDSMLNKKSGVLGVSGVSSDFRDLEAAANEGNERAKLALEMFRHSVRGYVGRYASIMGGVDVITFAGGVGENGPDVRKDVLAGHEFMGIKIDDEKNNVRGKEVEISAADSKVRVFVVPTDEELTIARDTKRIIEGK
ncbi:MAG: acetate kinase [Clostridia bacterium]|nr:acetate kinase [Clostridia bacterium]